MIKRISYLLIALFILSLAIPSLPQFREYTALAQDTLRVAKILETQGDVKVSEPEEKNLLRHTRAWA
ncbi:MAG: hypothetical protein ACOXZ6_11815 [Syntrophomonadaceae bacterium]